MTPPVIKALFLDRDGVINIDKGYVHHIDDFEFIKKSVDALKILQDNGFMLFIITNQSGIGRGHYTEEQFNDLNLHMLGLLSGYGVGISRVYHCPHDPDEGCSCRKPGTKFVMDAQKEFGVDLKVSFVVGDKTSDIQMGKKAGCRTILVKTGKGGRDGRHDVKPDFIAKDLYAAAGLILENDKEQTKKA